jgi:hypothetical protein
MSHLKEDCMSHPLVDQLRFTRHEWLRGLRGVSSEDASRHFGPMNCISWIVGHMAWHEQRTWLQRPQGIILIPELNTLFAFGASMSSPALAEMMRAWRTVTRATDDYLDSLTTEILRRDLPPRGRSVRQSIGSAMRRVTYHYWYHIGENQAIRQMLRHRKLPVYVGNIEGQAPYRPE